MQIGKHHVFLANRSRKIICHLIGDLVVIRVRLGTELAIDVVQHAALNRRSHQVVEQIAGPKRAANRAIRDKLRR
jgi:hypothetical protein